MSGVVPIDPSAAAERRPAEAPTPAAFKKRGAPARLDREETVLRHLQASRTGRTLVPALLGRAGDTLHLEALEGFTSLHDGFLAGGPQDDEPALLAALGKRLATLHGISATGLPPAIDPVPRLALTPRAAAELPGAMLDLIALLQRTDGLAEALENLRVRLGDDALVHGDLKLDNVMADRRGRLALVDFEHAGAGDAAWDLGAGIGDLVSRWLLSVPAPAGGGLAAWLSRASVPRTRVAAAARALRSGYARQRPLPAGDDVAACAGVFLLHRAQAWIERYGRLTAKPTLLARAGSGLVLRASAALEPILEDR